MTWRSWTSLPLGKRLVIVRTFRSQYSQPCGAFGSVGDVGERLDCGFEADVGLDGAAVPATWLASLFRDWLAAPCELCAADSPSSIFESLRERLCDTAFV